jgi:hypothetical protein
MKMTVTVTLGALAKLILALTTVLTVLAILVTDATRQDTQAPTEAPPTVNIRTDP